MDGRAPLTVSAVVATARRRLAAGGLECVTIRDVAKDLKVTSPALYKHVSGRFEIVDLLGASCLEELTGRVVQARDAVAGSDHHGRLLAAAEAWFTWAHAHPAEHGLLFATPATPFERPEGGRSHQAGLRLGGAFLEILVPAARAGRLRADADPPAGCTDQLRSWSRARDLQLTDQQLYSAVRGFHDCMGLIMVESFGQLGFALVDTGDYMRRRLRDLVADLIIPNP